ncbi:MULTISPECIES: glycosyltransferase [Paenibacillus]|uniref:glycosyltransferase n=1 Tax=Paenibacillus TaxID=44249 RepID=UPI00096F8A50|nr:glycosyltransferase [Paenibacillus odorifer]OMD87465.1 hypothetical protein BSK53_00175 [Paenibacillus odorifer]
MNLLFLSEGAYFAYYQGAVKANRAVFESLAARGHQCRVVHLVDQEDSLLQVEEQLQEHGVNDIIRSAHSLQGTVNGVECHFTTSVMLLYRTAGDLMKKGKPDVVLVNMAYHTMVAAGIKLVAGSASKLVVICHDVITLPFGPHSWIENPLLRQELAQVSGFIGDSDFVAHNITEWGSYTNAVSLRFPIYGDGIFPTFHNFNRGYIAICNPTEIKGLSIFLKLAQAFPDYPFAAIITWGDLKQEEQSALRALPNVTLLEPEREMNLIFEQVRVWLHPSICAEAFGQTVIEAMLRGIPVIASDQGGLMQSKCKVDYNLPVTPITETYKDEATGYTMPVIPEQDTAIWVETLQRLLTDRTLYESISAASKAAAQEFITEAQPEKFELYLENMLQSEMSAR